MKIWYFDKEGFHERQDNDNKRVEVSDAQKEEIFTKLSNPNKILILSQNEETGRPIIIDQTNNEDSKLSYLRGIRDTQCFSIVNRGALWYESLTEEQKQELKIWYQQWLDVTETRVMPIKPEWLQ